MCFYESYGGPWVAYAPKGCIASVRVCTFGQGCTDIFLILAKGTPFPRKFGDLNRISEVVRRFFLVLEKGTHFLEEHGDLNRISEVVPEIRESRPSMTQRSDVPLVSPPAVRL